MEIVREPSGQQAPDDADCISVVQRSDGLFDLRGSALIACGDGDEVESVSLIGLPPYLTRDEAEDAGIAWAAEQCVECLHVTDIDFDVER